MATTSPVPNPQLGAGLFTLRSVGMTIDDAGAAAGFYMLTLTDFYPDPQTWISPYEDDETGGGKGRYFVPLTGKLLVAGQQPDLIERLTLPEGKSHRVSLYSLAVDGDQRTIWRWDAPALEVAGSLTVEPLTIQVDVRLGRGLDDGGWSWGCEEIASLPPLDGP